MRDADEDSSELTRALLYGRGQDRTIEPPIIGAATVELSKAKALLPISQCCGGLGELSASQLKLREMRCGLDNGRPGLPLLNEFIFHCSVGQ